MAKVWNGEGMSQDDFMKKDECILVDQNDTVIGNCSKYDSHVFSPETPRGKLHRAFSVFLFNSEGKLLLQQRAASKVTFPDVWTNTCCSHPLYGYNPCEVDTDEDIASGDVPGAKNAAIRKLKQELGIEAVDVPITKFKFLTRLHYWAADVVTHGKESPWGEHEIDFILFIQADVPLDPNPDEVSGTKYVTLQELREQMDPKSGLLWSPWFRIIVENFLPYWWEDLNVTLTTNKFLDTKSIHRFDPSEEHMGGAGHAGKWLGKASSPYAKKAVTTQGDKSLKQGAYGKVKIHKHSKFSQLVRINEVMAALQLYFGTDMSDTIIPNNEDEKFCDEMLGKVSRSFAAVIRQLPNRLAMDVLIFYLVLRALDTVEDDMTAFEGRLEEKMRILCNFDKIALADTTWTMTGVGEGDEAVLLEQFPRVSRVYQSLPCSSQVVIADITKRMGEGMASYVSKDMGQGTATVADYDLYCHYVAGLVGEGLSQLFSCTGYESAAVNDVSKTLANTMGLFLQKTNIIRDYLEDFVDGRAFWPREVWRKYTPTDNLGDLADVANSEQAVACLNHLVTNALECVPECLDYLSMLETPEVFRFCAIPQVMAIATLHELYNNPKVFTGVVKIRKGMASELILDTGSMVGVHKWFNRFARNLLKRVPKNDPSAEATIAICEKIVEITQTNASIARQYALLDTSAHVLLAFPFWYALRRLNQKPIFTCLGLFVGYPLAIFLTQLSKGRGVWKWLRFTKKSK